MNTKVRAHPRVGTRGVRQHVRLLDRPYGVISASDYKLSREENKRRTRELGESLRERGYKPVPALGRWKNQEGHIELKRGYFVPRLSDDDAMELGKRYSQYELLLDNGLIRVSNGERIAAFNPSHTLFDGEAKKMPANTTLRDPRTGLPFVFALRP